MRASGIIREIGKLDLYTKDQFEEYVSSFTDIGDVMPNTSEGQDTCMTEIEYRIRSKKGTLPAQPDYTLSEKIICCEYLNSYIDSEMAKNATLGVVSGCFDLLHLGHIRGMVYAKQFLSQHDYPILLALTLSDDNIRSKKGDTRPVLDINERLDMICHLTCVDYVIPLQMPNCLDALDILKPKYFFKTSADRLQDIVRQEMELVEKYGGLVVSFPPRPNRTQSTTQMIDSVIENMMREW